MNDTHPDIEAMRYKILREMPVWRKLDIMFQTAQMLRTLALNDLRRLHPDDSEDNLRRRLAARLYGKELAEKAYGPLDE